MAAILDASKFIDAMANRRKVAEIIADKSYVNTAVDVIDQRLAGDYDNGIGRNAATVLNNKITSKHSSYGMKATTERIALINQIYKTGASVSVHDLVNDKGQAAGTQVTLQIPV